MILNYGQTAVRKFALQETSQWAYMSVMGGNPRVTYYNSHQVAFGPNYNRVSFWTDYGGISNGFSGTLTVPNGAGTVFRITAGNERSTLKRVVLDLILISGHMPAAQVSTPKGTLNTSRLVPHDFTLVWEADDLSPNNVCAINIAAEQMTGSVTARTLTVEQILRN